MNTVVKNSLDQDQTVNQEHTQFTNPYRLNILYSHIIEYMP